jgi:uncharacterized protein (DUF427 family)
MKATWHGVTLAESDQGIVIEGNYYFPPDSIKAEYFQPSNTHTTCHWKGQASYRTIVVNGNTNVDAAWLYPEPLPAAKEISGYYAFWHGVTVRDE